MNDEIAKRIDNIRDDRLHGAGWIAAYAVETLVQAILDSSRKDIPGILEEASTVLDSITAARKNMVYITNTAYLFLSGISRLKGFESDVKCFKEDIAERGQIYLEKMEASAESAAANAATMIFKGDTVLTCSYSSMLVRTFLAAKNRNPSFRVLVCRSSFHGIDYSENLKADMDRHGIKNTILEDTEIGKYAETANEVMIGADAVLPAGDLVNGSPSLLLAEAAWNAGICTFIVCEDAKFDSRKMIDTAALEPGFDLVPAGLWTAIITESGKIAPAEFREHLKYLEVLYK